MADGLPASGRLRGQLFKTTRFHFDIGEMYDLELPETKRGPWTPEEDESLTNAIALVMAEGSAVGHRLRIGATDSCDSYVTWTHVAAFVQTCVCIFTSHSRSLPALTWVPLHGRRTGKQCRERYVNNIDPALLKGNWHPNEDARLIQAAYTFGRAWSIIKSAFPGRSDNDCKNRVNTIIASQKWMRKNLLQCKGFDIAEITRMRRELADKSKSDCKARLKKRQGVKRIRRSVPRKRPAKEKLECEEPDLVLRDVEQAVNDLHDTEGENVFSKNDQADEKSDPFSPFNSADARRVIDLKERKSITLIGSFAELVNEKIGELSEFYKNGSVA